jgi:hypothetical protein
MSLGLATYEAVERGLAAALLVDHRGNVVDKEGAVTSDEVDVLVNVLMSLSGDEKIRQLFAGELIEFSLDGRDARIGVAGKLLFVISIGAADAAATSTTRLAQEFREDVAMVLDSMRVNSPVLPVRGGASGPPSGPADLPLAEIGVTFGLGRPKRGSA